MTLCKAPGCKPACFGGPGRLRMSFVTGLRGIDHAHAGADHVPAPGGRGPGRGRVQL
jgi:hypothetical protein